MSERGTSVERWSSASFHAEVAASVSDVAESNGVVLTGYASHAELVRYVDLARRTGCVARATAYLAALEGEPVSTHAQYDFPVRGWFLELLAD